MVSPRSIPNSESPYFIFYFLVFLKNISDVNATGNECVNVSLNEYVLPTCERSCRLLYNSTDLDTFRLVNSILQQSHVF